MTERIFAIAHLADQTVLYLLLLLTALAVYLIIIRFLSLNKASNLSRKIKAEIEQALIQGRYEYVEVLAKDRETPVGRICHVALKHLQSNGQVGLEELFRSLTMLEKPRLEKSLGFLATVGSNAPYIGLFGTVLGIMKSFHDLGQSSGAGQNTVMAGISAALIATAAGLLVAIPSVLAYNYFQRQVKSIMGGVDTAQELFMIYAKAKGANHGISSS